MGRFVVAWVEERFDIETAELPVDAPFPETAALNVACGDPDREPGKTVYAVWPEDHPEQIVKFTI